MKMISLVTLLALSTATAQSPTLKSCPQILQPPHGASSSLPVFSLQANGAQTINSTVLLNPQILKLAGEAGGHNSKYVSDLKLLASGLQRFSSEAAAVERVLYPFSGADGAMAFHLFPNATEVVAIDKHPFYTKKINEAEPLIALPNAGASFRRTTTLNTLNEGVGSRILGFFVQTFQDFHLRKITTYENYEKDKVERSLKTKRVHTVIEFDTGPGTLVRRYTHLNINFDTNDLSGAHSPDWWIREISNFKPQAVIVKAAHFQYSGLKNRFRKFILSTLHTNKAFLIEGAEVDGLGDWEFSSLYDGDWLQKFTSTTSEKLAEEDPKLKNIEFGYAGQVNIIRFIEK